MVPPQAVLRIAMPTQRLVEIVAMYTAGLGFEQIGAFDNHRGFDGVMLGHPQHAYHLEFTYERGGPPLAPAHPDQLLVFFVPDKQQWQRACERARDAGFVPVAPHNPYWSARGETFADLEQRRVVLQHDAWSQ